MRDGHEVVAYVEHFRRPRLEREARVEADDAVRLRRRYRQAPARILERTAAHPAAAVLNRVQHGEQQVTLRSRDAASIDDTMVHRLARTQPDVDARQLVG